MSETLTLPGTIPWLLRWGSPVVRLVGSDDPRASFCPKGTRGLVMAVRGENALVAWEGYDPCWRPLREIALDLTDATGRAHAAWWVEAASAAIYGESYRMRPEALRAMRLAASGADMPDAQVAILRDLCLHVAGVTP